VPVCGRHAPLVQAAEIASIRGGASCWPQEEVSSRSNALRHAHDQALDFQGWRLSHAADSPTVARVAGAGTLEPCSHSTAWRVDMMRLTKSRGGDSPNSQSAHPPRSGFVRRISASRCPRWRRIRSGSAWPCISSDARAFAGGEIAERLKSRVRFMVLPTGFEPAARISLKLNISLQHIWHVSVCPAGALVVPPMATRVCKRVTRGFGKCRYVAPTRPRGYCRSSCDKPGKIAVSVRRSGIGLSQKFIEAIDHK